MLRELLHRFQLPSFPLDTNEKKEDYLSIHPRVSISLSVEIFLAKSRFTSVFFLSSFVTCDLRASPVQFLFCCVKSRGASIPNS